MGGDCTKEDGSDFSYYLSKYYLQQIMTSTVIEITMPEQENISIKIEKTHT